MGRLEHCRRCSAPLCPLIVVTLVLATTVSCATGGVRPSTSSSPSSASGSKKTEIWQIDLLPDNGGGRGGGNGGGFGPIAPPQPPPVIHHHHHQANDRGAVGGGVHHVGNMGLHAFSTAGGGGESYEQQQIPLHAIVHTPMQVDTTSRWPSSSDCAMTNRDMSAAAPLVALFVGLALALPMLGLLFIAKMHLLSALTGSSGTHTVTTSVGGRKEDVLERRLADAWPAFRDAVSKYVFDGRSVGTTKNMTAHSI